MAYDLKAVLRLKDEMSPAIKRAAGNLVGMRKETDSLTRAIKYVNKETKTWRDENGRLRDDMGRFASEGSRYSGTFDRMGGSISGVHGKITSLHSSILALAGAYVTLEGGKKLFDATIGAAAHTEMEQATIKALFNNTKKADEWFDYIQKRAKDSALFSMDDFLSSSKAYIPMTKDINQLKQLTALTERLAASNPTQGMEGASFAIRELMSGDTESLVDRFNLPRQWVNEIKGKSGQDFINAMDKVLNRIGFTDKFLNDISDTGLAKYNQLAEKIRLAFKDMGKDGLERSKPILDRLNAMMDNGQFKGVQSLGSDLITSAVSATEQAVVSADKFFQHLQSDEKWKKLSIGDKLIRLTEEGMDSLNKWMASGGSDKITEMAKPVAKTAVGVGMAIGEGVLKGVANYFLDHPIAGGVMTALLVAKNGSLLTKAGTIGGTARAIGGNIALGIAAGLSLYLIDYLSEKVDEAMDYVEKRNKERDALNGTPTAHAMNKVENTPKGQAVFSSGNMTAYNPTWWDKTKNWFENAFTNPFSHYNGISEVPYDNYPALLHKGEEVVPATKVGKGNGVNVTIQMNGLTIREEADVQRLAYALAQEIKGAAVGMA
jgi:hypothetical protein